jgi:LysR family glycine cleavage system transcriptional activator
MVEPLPPIDALQAFVQAARLLSFQQAAGVLHVSPSALSRRIQTLEDHLGVALFRRLRPGLELTAAGRSYLETAESVVAELRAAQDALAPSPLGPLRVSALESFSAKWLVPRLAALEALEPRVEIQLEATLRYADFDRDPVDVAIRFGRGPWPGLHSEPIVDLDFFPVCSPALRDGDPSLRAPADLAHHALIHVEQVPDAWRAWLRHAEVPDLEPARELRFDHVVIALSAAEAGRGVALTSRLLAEPELGQGRLCAPFGDLVLRSDETYHLVCRPEGLSDPRITTFRDWLVEGLAATA